MSEFRDRVPHEGLQCGASYGRFGCCLNAGHVQLGQMHLGVGADGHIIEWGD